MSKAEFEADIGGVGLINTTPAGPRFSISGTITAGLKSAVGRRIVMCVEPEEAAKWAWRLLDVVARHRPELAVCRHETWTGHPSAGGVFCAVCGARQVEGLRPVWSPAVPVHLGDDVRLSRSYLERMNDVKLREAADDVLTTLRKGHTLRERKRALKALRYRLDAARKEPAEAFMGDVPVRPLRVDNLAETDSKERERAEQFMARGPAAPVAREPESREEHESQQSVRRARARTKLSKAQAHTLLEVARGNVTRSEHWNVYGARADTLGVLEETHRLVEVDWEAKPKGRVHPQYPVRLTKRGVRLLRRVKRKPKRVELREPDGLVWIDDRRERAAYEPDDTRYHLASESIRNEGTWWDVIVFDEGSHKPTRKLSVSSGDATKERARNLIRADIRRKRAGYPVPAGQRV